MSYVSVFPGLLGVLTLTLTLILVLLFSSMTLHSGYSNFSTVFTMKHANQRFDEKQSSEISHLYSDLNLHVYGQWKYGFLHDRTNFSRDYFFKCNKSKEEKPLHFEFYDNRLNEVNAIERLRGILRKSRLLLIGDSTTREFFFGICALLDLQVSNCFDKRAIRISITWIYLAPLCSDYDRLGGGGI